MSSSPDVTLLKDEDNGLTNLQSSTTVAGMVAETRRAEVISKIEAIITLVVEGLANNKTITLPIKSRPQTRADRPSGLLDQEAPLNKTPSACYPSKSATVGIRILELIHEVLVKNTITTKRDIYYKDPALFRSQQVVDRWVDDIAFTFGLQRASLNVAAAAKGLMAGHFTVTKYDGTVFDGLSEMKGMLIPHVEEVQFINISQVAWILVIEKEATFQALASTLFYRNAFIGDGIILTAKGYPDISTRAFLRRLSTSHAADAKPPPVLALVDYDPDGIAILLNYKYGSIALAHENIFLNVPVLQWLGVKSFDLQNGSLDGNDMGLLKLTDRDRKTAINMLKKAADSQEEEKEEYKRELQVMLMLNMKAEIQLLSGRQGGLEAWLESKIST